MLTEYDANKILLSLYEVNIRCLKCVLFTKIGVQKNLNVNVW
jgi:hypothetical protein